MQLQNVRGLSNKFIRIVLFCLFISRGFGFITFKDANSVEKVLAKDVHMLDEKQVCHHFKHQFDKAEKTQRRF